MKNIVNVNVQLRRKIECIRQRIFWYYHGTTRSLHCVAVRAASVIKQGPRVGGQESIVPSPPTFYWKQKAALHRLCDRGHEKGDIQVLDTITSPW